MAEGSRELGPGITEEAVLAAIEASGYPLQTVASTLLDQRGYLQTEEWTYPDADTGETRALDVEARLPFEEMEVEWEGRHITVVCTVLIECKQSALPFIAFEAVKPPPTPEFPLLSGFPYPKIELWAEKGNRFDRLGLMEFTRMSEYDFAARPPIASSITSCVRDGKGLKLTGETAFRSLMMPLVKAADHVKSIREGEPPSQNRPEYWDGHLVFPLVVLRAPLVLAETPRSGASIREVDWVRVVRHHPASSGRTWEWREPSMVDVVHVNFLERYLEEHVEPFCREFAERIASQAEIFTCGSAFLEGFDFMDYPDDFLDQVQPYEPLRGRG